MLIIAHRLSAVRHAHRMNTPTAAPTQPDQVRHPVLALLWSYFGEVDIVAVAPGRIMVSERTKVIQPLEASIAKLEATVPMAQKREADFTTLVDQGFMSGHATSSHSQLQTDAAKATQRERQTQLSAPVAGVIQQLAIHSVGGVVTSAQPLMIVVPESPTVTAEVTVANQDIGFVYAGQLAEVKLETFSYTKYGTVQAKVEVVTADAVTDEKKGSYYPATLTLSQKDMLIDGKRVALSPGMNITAEIKTGKRRVIEFLLSPVQRAGSESLRER